MNKNKCDHASYVWCKTCPLDGRPLVGMGPAVLNRCGHLPGIFCDTCRPAPTAEELKRRKAEAEPKEYPWVHVSYQRRQKWIGSMEESYE